MNNCIPKGPWTKNLDEFPKNFREESILHYKNMDGGSEKHHILGYRMFKASKIRDVFIHHSADGNGLLVKAKVDAAMKKKTYLSYVFLDKEGNVTGGHCQCVGGISGKCKHVFAILWQLLDFIREEKSFIPEDVPVTSQPRLWGQGSSKVCVDTPLDEIDFTKPDPLRKEKITVDQINQRRIISKLHCQTERLTEDVLRQHSVMFKEHGLSFLAEVIESNNFLPVKPNNSGDKDSEATLDLPLSVRWEEILHSVREQYKITNFEKLLNKCSLSINEAQLLQKRTVDQNSSALWYHERSKRLTASKFGDVIKRKQPVNQAMIERIWPKKHVTTALMKLGIENEEKAVRKYLEMYPNYRAFKVGLCVNPGVPYLAASPDRVIHNVETNEWHLLEIKTLVKGGLTAGLSVSDCIKKGYAPYLENVNDTIVLNLTHAYYLQIQGQMALTGLNRCHFMVDSGCDVFIEDVGFDEHLWTVMCLPILTAFYFNNFEKSHGNNQ